MNESTNIITRFKDVFQLNKHSDIF